MRLVARVNEADTKREAGIRKIVSVRRYVLHNKRWEKDAVIRVRMTYEAGTGKKFEILQLENAGGLQKHALEKILESEVEASKGNIEEQDTAITSANYDFDLIGSEIWNGRECYMLQLVPKTQQQILCSTGKPGLIRLSMPSFGSRAERREAFHFGLGNQT